jgi:hypothetical protein
MAYGNTPGNGRDAITQALMRIASPPPQAPPLPAPALGAPPVSPAAATPPPGMPGIPGMATGVPVGGMTPQAGPMSGTGFPAPMGPPRLPSAPVPGQPQY